MWKGEAGEGMESIRQGSGPSRVVRGLERKFKRVGDTADSGRERSRARVSTFLNLRPCAEGLVLNSPAMTGQVLGEFRMRLQGTSLFVS